MAALRKFDKRILQQKGPAAEPGGDLAPPGSAVFGSAGYKLPYGWTPLNDARADREATSNVDLSASLLARKLGSAPRRLYEVLLSLRNQAGLVWALRTTLAVRANLSDKQVENGLARLRKLGLLENVGWRRMLRAKHLPPLYVWRVVGQPVSVACETLRVPPATARAVLGAYGPGGRRPGAGRPPGSQDRQQRTRRSAERIEADKRSSQTCPGVGLLECTSDTRYNQTGAYIHRKLLYLCKPSPTEKPSLDREVAARSPQLFFACGAPPAFVANLTSKDGAVYADRITRTLTPSEYLARGKEAARMLQQPPQPAASSDDARGAALLAALLDDDEPQPARDAQRDLRLAPQVVAQQLAPLTAVLPRPAATIARLPRVDVPQPPAPRPDWEAARKVDTLLLAYRCGTSQALGQRVYAYRNGIDPKSPAWATMVRAADTMAANNVRPAFWVKWSQHRWLEQNPKADPTRPAPLAWVYGAGRLGNDNTLNWFFDEMPSGEQRTVVFPPTSLAVRAAVSELWQIAEDRAQRSNPISADEFSAAVAVAFPFGLDAALEAAEGEATALRTRLDKAVTAGLWVWR